MRRLLSPGAERLAREARDEPKHAIALEIKALTAPTFGEALAPSEQAAAAYRYRRAGSDRRLALVQCSLTYNPLVHGDLRRRREGSEVASHAPDTTAALARFPEPPNHQPRRSS